MLAIPFDAEKLTHVVYVLDPRPAAERLQRLYREFAALDATRVRGTVLSTGGEIDVADRLKGFELELVQVGTRRLAHGNPFGRVVALRERLSTLRPDVLRLETDGSAVVWRIAARLAGVPRVVTTALEQERALPPAAPVAPREAGAPMEPGPSYPAHLALILKSDVGRPSAHVAQALNTAAALLERGMRVSVVGPLAPGNTFETALHRSALGAGIDAAGATRIRHVPLDEVKRSARSIAQFREMLDRLKEDGVDVLYFRQVRIASMLLPYARERGFTVVMEAHQPYATWAIAERQRLWRGDPAVRRHALAMARRDRDHEHRCYRELHGVVCTTRAVRRHVRRAADVPTLLLRNGAPEPIVPETPYVEEARASRPLDVIYVGKTSIDKGTDVILDAIALLPGARLLVVGGPSEVDLAPFREQAERLGIAARVEFRSWVTQQELFELIRAAKVAVHPLPGRGSKEWRIYTCPLKILEYMALGTPVVATDLPAVREIVRQGCTGLLVEPDSPRALADGISRLLADRALAGRLRDAALRRVRSWSHARRADQLWSFLRSLRGSS